jgi:carbonic anhydrase/acetyltransferase-like protein (isoleucine patch superfamily)
MLIRHRGAEPRVDPSAYVAPTATLAGAVTIGPRARVMFGAVLDAEGSRVEVGECAIVCEHAVLRATAVGDEDHPVLVGDHAFVGPHATLLGCAVEAAAYIATGATARAFGVTTAWEDRAARYREIAEVRAREFGAHIDDAIVS